jgi:hypothetical protein
MLYVAFLSFCYAMVALWFTSYFTQPLPVAQLADLVYRRDPGTPRAELEVRQ